MTGNKWDPFRNAGMLQNRINQLFEDSFPDSGQQDEDLALCAWNPAVDIYETADDIIILMDTAGIDVSNISITAENKRITVEGRRSLPKRGNVCCIHQLEIEMGYFKRTISFPVPVKFAKPAFNCQNGIMEIRLPKETKSCSMP